MDSKRVEQAKQSALKALQQHKETMAMVNKFWQQPYKEAHSAAR